MRILVGLALFATACTDDVEGPPGDGVCVVPASMPDAGVLSALKAQRCNQTGSMGMRKWYRLSATLPDGVIVQLELYDQAGAFAGGAVRTGTFPVETSFGTCGVCLRAIADKGMATQQEFFGTGGMVNITAIGANGAPISATIANATFGQVDANHAAVSNGCSSTLIAAKIDGVVMDIGGSTGGGGGGGGGGSGSCPTTVGD